MPIKMRLRVKKKKISCINLSRFERTRLLVLAIHLPTLSLFSTIKGYVNTIALH